VIVSGRLAWRRAGEHVADRGAGRDAAGPDDDETEITAVQVRDVVARLIEAGRWREGDPAILVVFDAGYDVTRLAWLLADLPVELLGRLRSDRVKQLPAPPRLLAPVGRPRKHGTRVQGQTRTRRLNRKLRHF